MAGAFELAAGGEDVAATRGADRRGIAGAVEHGGEGLDRRPIAANIVRAWPGIERDQIDLGRHAGHQLHQCFGLGQTVVDAFQHNVLKRHALGVGQARIGADGVKQGGEIVFLVQWDQLIAQLIGGGVQADRQHGAGAGAQFGDFGGDAGGADGDAAAADRDAVAIGDDVDRVGDGVQIIERLAHAHEDDVGELAVAIVQRSVGGGPFGQAVARDQDLGDDFSGGQVADQLLGAGMAE